LDIDSRDFSFPVERDGLKPLLRAGQMLQSLNRGNAELIQTRLSQKQKTFRNKRKHRFWQQTALVEWFLLLNKIASLLVWQIIWLRGGNASVCRLYNFTDSR
jgi:hypothetical protein